MRLLHERRSLMLTLAACVSMLFAGAATGAEYAKQDSWAESLLFAREVYANSPVSEKPVTMGDWYLTDPILCPTFGTVLEPEKGVDLKAKQGSTNGWKKRPELVDGKVYTLPGRDRAATYLYRTIDAASAIDLPAGFGSDDGLAVWLNGKNIISQDVPRGPGVDQDRAVLKLKEGKNELLLKIYNQTGGHGYYFSAGNKDARMELLMRVRHDFPQEMGWLSRDLSDGQMVSWMDSAKNTDLEQAAVKSVLNDLGAAGSSLLAEASALVKTSGEGSTPQWLNLYTRSCGVRDALASLGQVNFTALRMAIEDLTKTYPDTYKKGPEYLARLDSLSANLPKLAEGVARGDAEAVAEIESIRAMASEALLANPLLDFDELMFVRRKASGPALGLPQNWQGNCSLPRSGYDDEVAALKFSDLKGATRTIYKPEKASFVGDVDLHWDADKMLFSAIGTHNRWQIMEVGIDGKGLRQLTSTEYPDVDNYDPVYLADDRIIFGSTAAFHGVPCVGGADTVANLFIFNPDGSQMRQLTFDQDHDWCPVVLNNGRLLYTRWEYSDTSHYFTRLLFHMNPDGTSQMEYSGSNSYWPNSTFYARPIPGDPTKVIAVISGHHGVARMGELIIFDPAKGRREADGVVQRIPGFGKKVEPVIVDQLVNPVWPKFLHPMPLSAKYFLVSCQPTQNSQWGLYLVDTFDNMTLLREEPGYVLFEPVPLRKVKRPPVIADRVDLARKDAIVYMADIYAGPGLKGVPKESVKKMRVYSFHYAYPRMGGHVNVAIEGGWDVKRILGTVDVEKDGSAMFRVPANTPIAIQPLDEENRSMQVMRSWFVAMPGETLSCVGCHESQSSTPSYKPALAARKAPQDIKEWYGPARGFSFSHEVQPVLDKYCVGCHDGEKKALPDFSRKEQMVRVSGNPFTSAYVALHPYVRRPGPESDYHIEQPLEWHASTSELVQMLKKGHHNVKMDGESWDRLYTWIDLNVPDHGSWSEHRAIPSNFRERRLEMRRLYAGYTDDEEDDVLPAPDAVECVMPLPLSAMKEHKIQVAGWPFDSKSALEMQRKAGAQAHRTVDLGDGIKMDLALIPAGEFAIGSWDESFEEGPRSAVKINRAFWIGTTEVTHAQFRQFDPLHDNRYLDQQSKDHTTPGYPINGPDFPVVRITWQEAMAYCEWLSEKTGMKVSLPTEAQWEWACRAGSDADFSYGDFSVDFGKLANMADQSVKALCVRGVNPQPIANPGPGEAFVPRDDRFNDGQRIMCNVAQYAPNAWGLFDMHGNTAEWTLSDYVAYPYSDGDGRNSGSATAAKVVRGGSWRDRPARSTSSFRLAYPSWQKVYNVGLRVVIDADGPTVALNVE